MGARRWNSLADWTCRSTKRRFVWSTTRARCIECIVVQSGLQFLRQDTCDFGERIAGGVGQFVVSAPSDPFRPQRQRLDFLFGENQRRRQKAGAKHIAHSRLAVDFGSHRLQGGEVAIKRAQGTPASRASSAPLTGRRRRRSICRSSNRRWVRDMERRYDAEVLDHEPPKRSANAVTSVGATKRKTAFGSTKRRMSYVHAIRSTFGRARVTQIVRPSSLRGGNLVSATRAPPACVHAS